MADRRPPLRVAPLPEEATAHRPVCRACGEQWPCSEQRAEAALGWAQRRREMDCWSCGKPAKSPTGFGVMLPGRGIVLSRWCGPAKHRRCDEIAWMYREADLRARRVREVGS